MTLIQGVAHVNLTIEDEDEALEQARHFYGEILGLQPLPRPERTDSGRPGLWYRCGSQEVHISMEKDAKSFNKPSNRHAAFAVSDLAGLRQRLIEADTEISGGVQFEGQSRFFARDKWGNRLEFVQYN